MGTCACIYTCTYTYFSVLPLLSSLTPPPLSYITTLTGHELAVDVHTGLLRRSPQLKCHRDIHRKGASRVVPMGLLVLAARYVFIYIYIYTRLFLYLPPHSCTPALTNASPHARLSLRVCIHRIPRYLPQRAHARPRKF